MEVILANLSSVESPSVKNLGGKAYSLFNLKRAGFTIPETHVLDVKMIELIRLGAQLNDGVLAEKRYAVRSSGVAEDGKNHSYAGLYDTYLNVNRRDVTYFVSKCIDSSNNKRLQSYERQLGLIANSEMCVIVQEMVDSEIAGVCFTVNPINGNSREIVVEFCAGLGDKVVGGEVSPISIIIDRETIQILNIYHGDYSQNIANRYINTILNLAEICIRIEKLYGYPVDIEWAVKENEIVILQARAITTLKKSE
jgi:phosphoenolpyruvate synthase/pyruvate phosphate dikinase